ncbi:ATP-binding cassette domain-containing protein [Streptomyces sp. SID3343]|uniref:ATP-binding cassette domain-containing protein n=1 Tax=Streptomyces sp. SID3343 TaxID=2690260 RepID=UPI00136F63CF|nr:ATP-binding cassette domain-containing protein [Streptomyces sp. SID3343]MYW03734.1 ATP-binding cassette domain-containing protein [Streptomyces sp. SID3343]
MDSRRPDPTDRALAKPAKPAGPTPPAALVAEGLWKTFGKVEALRGFDLTVPAGTVCGLLGLNGAGKTTAVRVFSTLVTPDAGSARVAGHDVVRDPGRVRRLIGLAGQHAALEEGVTGRENLVLFGRFNRLGSRAAKARADELLTDFGLADAADRLVRTYSGGMRRRLDLITSLITRPPVLFLDEPTTGLDPRSRNDIWRVVRELAAEGTTVLLTTQYLDEADRLADAVAVVEHGRVIASGTPERLKAAIGTSVEVTVLAAADLETTGAVLGRLGTGEPVVDRDELRLRAVTRPGAGVSMPHLIRELDAAGVTVVDVALRAPSLDDVFLTLTTDPTAAASTAPATPDADKATR